MKENDPTHEIKKKTKGLRDQIEKWLVHFVQTDNSVASDNNCNHFQADLVWHLFYIFITEIINIFYGQFRKAITC